VREDSRKKSNRNAKSAWFIAGKARIIKYLREPKRRCKCDASREATAELAGELERVAILGLHRPQSRRQRAAFQAERVTFFTGTTPDRRS
jgi:hypothetical protein